MWVEASCLSIPTSVGGHGDTASCLKGRVAMKTKHSHEEPASQWNRLTPNPPHTLSSGLISASLHWPHGWRPGAWPHDLKGLLGWYPAPGPCYPTHREIAEVTLEMLWESNSPELVEVGEGKNRERYYGEGWEDGESHQLLPTSTLLHGIIFFSNKYKMFRSNAQG